MSDEIKITLTAYNMGPDATEADFDAWDRFVRQRIESACDLPEDSADVRQFPFANGPAEDHVFGGTSQQREVIREWLSNDGWGAFCADPTAWPKAAE